MPGTLSRSALVELGAEKSAGECTLALPWGLRQRRRGASGRDRGSVHGTIPELAKTVASTQHKPQPQSDVTADLLTVVKRVVTQSTHQHVQDVLTRDTWLHPRVLFEKCSQKVASCHFLHVRLSVVYACRRR